VVERQTIHQILELIPQQPPFRFIDDILEVDDKEITAVYRFRESEYFYKGHFPGNPVTPGVILTEAMAQTGVVALGIYLLLHQGLSVEELKQMTTLFAFADAIEFTGIVQPGEKVIIRGEKVYLRKGNLKTKVCMFRDNGEIVCSGILTGTGVKASAKTGV
jgi:3-hydroxyacyl-[acyl-carrier-protein] dehydratase